MNKFLPLSLSALLLAGCATPPVATAPKAETPAEPAAAAPAEKHVSSSGWFWLRNIGEGENALAGTLDWTRFELTVPAQPGDRAFAILLRSDRNAGTAWFDDVEVLDASGAVVRRFGFDKDAEGFRAEREPKDCMAYDAEAGHDAPGALRVAATAEYNGWLFSHIETADAETVFTVRGWVKLADATGKTYIAAAMNGQE